MNFIQKIISSKSFVCRNFVRKPIYIVGLFTRPEFYKSITYYPELPNAKSTFRVFCEQIMHILRYGHPEHFYFMYGMDKKYGKKYGTYVNYGPFMDRRDYLNYESHAKNNSCCLLRNKFYFGLFCNSIGIGTPQNLYYLSDNQLFKFDSRGG